jgi:hypothetical protein
VARACSRTAFGAAIARLLEDPAVVEVMLNPDGRLWIDRLASGLADTGEIVPAPDGERIVRLVAHHVGAEVHAGSPRVSAELPETGERFEGPLPPVVAAPAFAIRKPAVAVFTLGDYVAAGIMTSGQASALALTPNNNVSTRKPRRRELAKYLRPQPQPSHRSTPHLRKRLPTLLLLPMKPSLRTGRIANFSSSMRLLIGGLRRPIGFHVQRRHLWCRRERSPCRASIVATIVCKVRESWVLPANTS